MDWLIRDLRFALRENGKRPGFLVLATLTLGVGIGAVTTMYSVIHNVLLNPFPYTDPRGMVDVVIQDLDSKRGSVRGGLATPEFRAYVDQSHVFQEAVGTDTVGMLYRSDAGNEQFVVCSITPNTLHFLGVPPLIGRGITDADAKPGAAPVALLSHKAWMTYFGGERSVVGRKIVLDDKPMTVVGVMPPRFTWNVAHVWIPDAVSAGDPNGMKRSFWLQARLKPGVSAGEAEAELSLIGQRLAQQFPERYPMRFKLQVIYVIDWVVGKFRGVLYALFGAVGLLLLIACCNVANMLLAKATAREREIAVRAALGATRLQILRQLLLESSVLALLGDLAGVAFAYWGTKALVHFIPPFTIPVETEISMNVPVLLFSLALALVTSLVFGVVPAIHSSRQELAPGLSAAGKGSGGGVGHGKLRNGLIVAEVALSLVLLAGAGVLMRSFFAMLNVDLGFNPHNVAVARGVLPNATDAQRRQFYEAATTRLRSVPGVIDVASGVAIPPFGNLTSEIDVPGKVHRQLWTSLLQPCGDRYFQVLGMRLMRGVAISSSDMATAHHVAVVNQTLVAKYFGDGDPIGQTIRVAWLGTGPAALADPTFQIIGVVGDARNRGVEEPAMPEIFIPLTAAGRDVPVRLFVRTAGEPSALFASIRREFHLANPNVVQRDPMTLDEWLRDFSYARPRFSVLLMGIFATVGLLLVGSGVYGVMAYSVSRETRDIGIRMALGAERGQVFRGVMTRALRLITLGVVLGGLASVATNRVIASSIWTVSTFDPIALTAGIAVIAVLGLLAGYVPALRATRVNPIVALRHE